MQTFHLHLVSDSTGETVNSVARAVLAQFEGVDAEEHVWPLVRTRGQMEKVVDSLRERRGIVLYTVVEEELRRILLKGCRELEIPCVPVLSRVVSELSNFLKVKPKASPGRQHELDEEYFARMEAINFTLAHDDGQSTQNLEEADMVLVGVSRTSKTPTCVYLAYRGYKAANVPFVPSIPLPPILSELKQPLVVGLSISPDRLTQIRKNRLIGLHEDRETDYIDTDKVKEELLEARRFFNQRQWPMLDVTRKSVEEIAATIIQYYHERKERGSITHAD